MRNFIEIHFEIESNCLLNCKHCSSFLPRNIHKLGYTIDDAKKLINLLDGLIYINLTGGEPLLNLHLLDIIKDFKRLKSSLQIGIFTCGIVKGENGLLCNTYREAQIQKDAGLDSCYISIYHNNSNFHDDITNVKDSLHYTKLSIKNFILAGVEVKIHLVINSYNINCIEDIILDLADLGVSEVRLLRLVNNGNALTHWNEIGVAYDKQNEVICNVFHRKDDYGVKLTFAGFPDLVHCRPLDEAFKCQAGTNLLYITFAGDIYPCACTRDISKHKIAHISEIDKIRSYLNDTNDYNKSCLNSPQ